MVEQALQHILRKIPVHDWNIIVGDKSHRDHNRTTGYVSQQKGTGGESKVVNACCVGAPSGRWSFRTQTSFNKRVETIMQLAVY